MQFTSRYLLLDLAKLMASFVIVAFHCGFLYDYNTFSYYIFCNGFVRIVVPFFLCISGFFIYTFFINNTFKHWVKRITILYLTWMLLYGFFWVKASLKSIITLLFGFNHLWYLAALLFGGILLYYIKNLSSKKIFIIAIALSIIGFTIQSLSFFNTISNPYFLAKIIHFTPTYRNFLFIGLPYLIIGFLIHRHQLHLKLKKNQIILFLVFGFTLLLLESLYGYYNYINRSLSIISLACLLLVPIIFIATLRFKLYLNTNSKLLSLYSIAVYLVHPIVIYFITQFTILDTITLTITTIVLSVIASYLIIQLNKTFKYLI